MALKETWNKLIGLDSGEDEITSNDIQSEMAAIKSREVATVTPFEPKASVKTPVENRSISVTDGGFKLVVIEPKSFDECPKLVDNLKGRRPVIINLEKVETDTARKIFDFLSGATYALDGNVQKVANNIFIFAPRSVDIAQPHEEKPFGFSGSGKNPWK